MLGVGSGGAGAAVAATVGGRSGMGERIRQSGSYHFDR